jgi:ADP-heptose:LPS heptosyltransferase
MSKLEKPIKKGFWLILQPLAGRLPSTARPLPPSPSLLILRPDRLGDFILSTPALAALLQKAGPSARLTLVAGVPNEKLARLLFPKARVWVFRKNIFSRIALLAKILLNRFDAVADFHSFPFSTTSGFMALASGSARRVGFVDFPEQKGIPEMIFNWGVPCPPASTHESKKSLLLSRRLYPKIKFPNLRDVIKLDLGQARNQIDDFFEKAGIKPGDRLMGMHPTLAKEDNRWNPDYYRKLLSLVPPRKGFKWVVLYGLGEEDGLEFFRKSIEDLPGIVFLPSSELIQNMAAASRCSLVVAGDSGLTHACALVTKVIALFGPSDPQQWSPLIVHRPLVIRSADRKCDSIRPEKVAQVLKNTLCNR